MAAPSNTVWGDIEGGYGRIGICITRSKKTGSYLSLDYEVWFWSKYSVSDSANTLYISNKDTPGASYSSVGSQKIKTTVATGEGWSDSNQVKLYSGEGNYGSPTTGVTRYISAMLQNVDKVGDTMYAHCTVEVAPWQTYTITYNANGGSGAPSSQTKTHGNTLILSTTKPTRTGYTFQGWATSSTATTAAYAAGGNYTGNGSVTLYAVWKANTYTVTYNANGGTGAPASQTKTYGVALTLSITKPTRTNYTFKGWAISAAATTAAYSAGGSYTANNTITLYAVWENAYVSPAIYNLTSTRCDSAGTETDDGTCGLIKFSWKCTYNVSSITIAWSSTSGNGEAIVIASGTSGSVNQVIGNDALSTDASYTITVTVVDSNGTNSATTTLSGNVFPLDCLAGGKGIAFGKPAELKDVADFAFDAKFNKPVYGKALGMDRLPAIPANSDLNDANYREPGCYAVHGNAVAETIANIPVARAGRFEVWSATGEGVRLEQWSYLRQRYIPYNSSNAVWERDVTRGDNNQWTYGNWWQSSLTPAAAEKVYSKAAATMVLSDATTLGIVNQYTTIPLDRLYAYSSDRLSMQNNSIRIGANIKQVKVSGQVLIKCGSVTGDRHVRIRHHNGTRYSDVAWACVYGVAGSNTAYTLPPIIYNVNEGDILYMVFYTTDSTDKVASGNVTNGWQTYLTVEEL
jgi:uncharacterized repeat protein (TIGR02543 family)